VPYAITVKESSFHCGNDGEAQGEKSANINLFSAREKNITHKTREGENLNKLNVTQLAGPVHIEPFTAHIFSPRGQGGKLIRAPMPHH
jgi:hypothetical protein